MDQKPAYEELEKRVWELEQQAESKRKRAENQLQESESKYHSLVNSLKDWVWIIDIEGTHTFCSRSIQSILGYKPQEIFNKSSFFMIHPDSKPEARAALIKAVAERRGWDGLELKWLHKDGSVRYLESTCQPNFDSDGNLIGFSGLDRDITDQKRAEEQLIESKLLLDATGRTARVGGWELDAETLEVSWTEETYRIHEVPLDRKPPLEEALSFYHPDDRVRLSGAIQRALESGEPYDLELRFISANGNELWTRTMCRPQIVDGRVVRLRGTFQDITDRKLASEALRESEEKFRSLVDQASEMLFLHDLQGHLVDVNIAAARNTGYAKEELTKMSVFDIDPDAGERDDMRNHWEELRVGDPCRLPH